ncbi:hypothetical protein [Brachybacterium sp. GPGPB12]|uniref:hypothetical protein n=1 Tax=Brachybacterium sp. GPGPB12 TaxID=3023517 RepID=UPI0031343548
MSQHRGAAPHTAEPVRAALDDTAPLPLEVHRVLPEQWRAHRDLRLDMLEADPDAFWADLAEVRSRTEEQWREEIAGPRIHLQARADETVLGGIALFARGLHAGAPDPRGPLAHRLALGAAGRTGPRHLHACSCAASRSSRSRSAGPS